MDSVAIAPLCKARNCDLRRNSMKTRRALSHSCPNFVSSDSGPNQSIDARRRSGGEDALLDRQRPDTMNDRERAGSLDVDFVWADTNRMP